MLGPDAWDYNRLTEGSVGGQADMRTKRALIHCVLALIFWSTALGAFHAIGVWYGTRTTDCCGTVGADLAIGSPASGDACARRSEPDPTEGRDLAGYDRLELSSFGLSES